VLHYHASPLFNAVGTGRVVEQNSIIKKLTQEKGKLMRKADKENPPYANQK
jgi:hypothetical protein